MSCFSDQLTLTQMKTGTVFGTRGENRRLFKSISQRRFSGVSITTKNDFNNKVIMAPLRTRIMQSYHIIEDDLLCIPSKSHQTSRQNTEFKTKQNSGLISSIRIIIILFRPSTLGSLAIKVCFIYESKQLHGGDLSVCRHSPNRPSSKLEQKSICENINKSKLRVKLFLSKSFRLNNIVPGHSLFHSNSESRAESSLLAKI